jgi:hypothetical protein
VLFAQPRGEVCRLFLEWLSVLFDFRHPGVATRSQDVALGSDFLKIRTFAELGQVLIVPRTEGTKKRDFFAPLSYKLLLRISEARPRGARLSAMKKSRAGQ